MNNRIKHDLQAATEENIPIIHTVSKMITAYVETWSPILDKGIEVLGVEQNLQVPVTLPSGTEVMLNCITDLIYTIHKSSLTIRDHKTGKAGSWSQTMIPLENQLLFNAAAYFLLTGEKPLRTEISWINSYVYKQKQPTIAERFQNYPHVHNEHGLAFYTEELFHFIDKMVNDERPVKNYSKDCGRCQFQPICSMELRGFDTASVKASLYEKVDRNYEVRLKIGRSESTESSTENPPADKEPFKLHLNL